MTLATPHRIALALALALALPANASAATAPLPDSPLVPLWRDLSDVPAPVVREAKRITRGMSRYGSEPTASVLLACERRSKGRRIPDGRLALPWACLSRFSTAAGHCDVVIRIGPMPTDIRRFRHGRVRYIKTVYGRIVSAQRFRVVHGGCTV